MPKRKASLPKISEHAMQKMIVQWWSLMHRRYALPEFSLYAVPNGGHRHPAVAAKLKAEGVRPGIPDIHVDVPRGQFHGLRLELKVKPNKPTPDQEKVLAFLNSQGYRALVVFDYGAAVAAIDAYLGGVNPVTQYRHP